MRCLFVLIAASLSSWSYCQDGVLLNLLPKPGAKTAQFSCGEINSERLNELVRLSSQTHTDALIVLKDGKTVAENYSRVPNELLPLYSGTKSIVSLAIGKLISEGKIRSLDEPLSTWFPEWKTGLKARVTLRNILTHTSALSHKPGDALLASQYDRLQYVRRLEILGAPGDTFSYNNEAVMLLSGIILMAAGQPADQYVAKSIFTPLGIRHWSWEKDAAGNVLTYRGLALEPSALAAIGQLLLQEGRWKDKTILPRDWVRLATSPSTKVEPRYGLLWWIAPSVPIEDNHPIGYIANGWQGEYLVVDPRYRLIAVRMRHPSSDPDEKENVRYGFSDFPHLALSLVNSCAVSPAN